MGKKAIIFPGQGSQYPQMGLSLYQNFQEAKKVFDLVERISGIKISEAIFSGDSSQLKDTAIQQLAILAVSLAAYELSKPHLGDVEFVLGLSLGEYSCLYAGGVLCLEDLILLVKARGQAMQKAAKVNPSSMFAVIGANRGDLEPKQRDLDFYISNMNAPSQIVISTKKKNKNELKNKLEKEGLRVIELKVSGGFHSPFMEPAREELKKVVADFEFSDAHIPIISNVTASQDIKSEKIKENLLKQLVSPVLWMDSIKYLSKKGINNFYEVGPSKVLKGLLRKIDRDLKVINIEKKEDLEKIIDN
ncbi:MAG: ACP S-malonyltransferase [Candidatus Omnitrophica bacterium]|nr:ACP S-malonyltransferase [Candidatus Omnitrophota bacterium]MCF7894519.1 ACP S-malonyltransferase [Candidatus Omnitrophota bacterium]